MLRRLVVVEGLSAVLLSLWSHFMCLMTGCFCLLQLVRGLIHLPIMVIVAVNFPANAVRTEFSLWLAI